MKLVNKHNIITVKELAKMLGISRISAFERVKQLLKENRIKATLEGKTYIIDKNSLPEELVKEIESKRKEVVNKLLEGKDLDFEKELWKAADRLRGNVEVTDYKHIVLGLLFLKYVSDSFNSKRESMSALLSDPTDEEGYYTPDIEKQKWILNDKNIYKSEGIFFIPETARWAYLQSKAMLPDIGKYLDEAMEKIEDENSSQLKGVLPKIYSRITIEPHVLGELVNIFSKISFDHDINKEKDILGRVYEYFLGEFATSEGKRGGEFYTPRSLVRLLVEILEPYENAKVFDPSCGSGGMFVQSGEFLKIHQKDPSKISFFGQELNSTTYNLCRMNLAIRGIFGSIEMGNSYYNDKFPDLRADFVLANPPFNAEWEPKRLPDSDPRLKYGIAPSGNANFMWVQHFLYHLAPNGMTGFVMANGALAGSGKEGEIRRKIIEDDLVDVIISCPPKLFYNVTLPVSLWFLTKNKKNGRFRNRSKETLFIDAREIFTPISRKQYTFSEEQLQRIVGTVQSWRGEEGSKDYQDVAGFCKAVKLEEIENNGFVLNPGRYVGIAPEPDDGIPFAEKIKKYKEDLLKYFDEGKKLEEEIKNNLKKINQ